MYIQTGRIKTIKQCISEIKYELVSRCSVKQLHNRIVATRKNVLDMLRTRRMININQT
jgi:hypothetical protein